MRAFPAETTEAFLEGHVEAFRYWGGVPRRILYDNTTLAVARILVDRTRLKTQAFSQLQSHYLFEERFGRAGKGNDDQQKGYYDTGTGVQLLEDPLNGSHTSSRADRLCSRCHFVQQF